MQTLRDIYQQLKQRFKDSGLSEAGLKAHLLLEWAAGVTYKDVIIAPDRQIDEESLVRLESGMQRMLRGESIHRIRGEREFYGLPFEISADTLEPRPDSETLIDLVLPFIRERAKFQTKIHLLDMGTGSGALAITLLVQMPQLYATAVDISAAALKVAVGNAERNGVAARFQPLLSDCFAKVEMEYDFIISNPPYIAHGDIAGLDKTVRDFDPLIALDGGADGLDFYRKLVDHSRHFLGPSGQIAVEIGQGQDQAVVSLFEQQGLSLTASANDLADIRRALLFAHRII